MKRFSEYTEDLQELERTIKESWLNKGFALTQLARHDAARQKISSSVSKIISLSNSAQSSDTLETKLDLLFQCVSESARVLNLHSELSRNTISVAVSSALFSENLEKTLVNVLKKAKLIK